MSTKKELIQEMLDMQRKFIEYEQQNGVVPQEYWAPDNNHLLFNYKEKYAELATKVLDMAHKDKGSKR